MNTELDAWVFLNHLPDMGPIRFHRLLHAAGSASEILPMNVAALRMADVSEDMARRWHSSLRNRDFNRRVEAELERAARGDFQIITELEDAYPDLLRELLDRPPVLYVKGVWPPPQMFMVGIVGTRRPTSYGLAVAERFTEGLCARQIPTVSGLATGIDRVVHCRTLDVGGFTVAVLGHGLGSLYPRLNADVFARIVERGALLTEFPFSQGPQTYHFPRRNRIIAGLSRGVLVIEAGERSGALITARNATEQGRDVFAVPGPIFEKASSGCHRLIKQGAKLVECVEDIFDEYEEYRTLKTAEPTPEASETVQRPIVPDATLPPFEQSVVQQMAGGEVSIDELSVTLSQPIEALANALLSLELKGKIRRLPGQRYANTFT